MIGRTFKRESLGSLFAALRFNLGAEIGVRKGQFSQKLLTANIDLRLLCVDAWMPYSEMPSARRMEAYHQETVRRLSAYRGATILRMTSVEAAKTVADGALDFVYIDAAHDFDSVMSDLIAWAPKVHRRGLVCGHDYVHAPDCGVIYAADAYRQAHGITHWYLTSDWPPSFMLVKP